MEEEEGRGGEGEEGEERGGEERGGEERGGGREGGRNCSCVYMTLQFCYEDYLFNLFTVCW